MKQQQQESQEKQEHFTHTEHKRHFTPCYKKLIFNPTLTNVLNNNKKERKGKESIVWQLPVLYIVSIFMHACMYTTFHSESGILNADQSIIAQDHCQYFFKHIAAKCDAIKCNAIQYNTIQYNTIQYNTIQYNTSNTIWFILLLGYFIPVVLSHPQRFFLMLCSNTIRVDTVDNTALLHFSVSLHVYY